MKGQRSKLRILGIVAAVLLVISGGVYLASLSMAEAGESPAADSQQAPAEKDSKEATEDDQKEKAAIPVEVTSIGTGPVASYISASANLVAENDVTVLAEAEGRISELRVEEGDGVSHGQTLAVINRDEAEIAVNKARLKQANAELAFERAAETLEQGLISREQYDRLQMEHEVAKQEVAEAEWRLQKTTIRAPFAGRVTERHANQGQHVRPGDALFRVADFDPLVARIYLPEKDVLNLRVGRKVRIALAAAEELAFAGAIRQISPVVDTATGTVKVTVEAEQTPQQVRPGSFVTVNIVREQRNDAVLVPRESVIRELRSSHVFIRDGEQAVKREVTLGLEEGNLVEVLSGVEPGDEVIVAGQGGLKAGAKIKVL